MIRLMFFSVGICVIFEKILGLSMMESRFSWFLVWFLWIIANALDVHSTYIFTKKDGHFENEGNFLGRFFMVRFGFKQAIFFHKIPMVLISGVVSTIFLGSNFLLALSFIELSVAVYNYWPCWSEP